MGEPLLPMDLHVQHDPNPRPPAPALCRFCDGEVEDDTDGGFGAFWGLCDTCFDTAEFED